MKPPVEIEQFRKLDLRVGTVASVRPHPSITSLSILTVLLDEPVEVLTPTSLAAGKAAGVRVVVAAGLYGSRQSRDLAGCDGAGPRRRPPLVSVRKIRQ